MHALRIDDELWSAALAKAKSQGRTLTQVINDSLAAYVAGPGTVRVIELEPKKIVSRRAARAKVPPAVIAVPPGQYMGGVVKQPDGSDAVPFADYMHGDHSVPVKGSPRPPCTHPKARVIKGYCGACGMGGLS